MLYHSNFFKHMNKKTKKVIIEVLKVLISAILGALGYNVVL